VCLAVVGCAQPTQRDPNVDPYLIRISSLESRMSRVEANNGIATPDRRSQKTVTIGAASETVVAAPVSEAETRKERLRLELARQQAEIEKLRVAIEQRRLEQSGTQTVAVTTPTQPAEFQARPVPVIRSVEPGLSGSRQTLDVPPEPVIIDQPAPAPTSAPSAAIELGGERDQYRAAYAMLQQGEAEEASRRFSSFIAQFPNSAYADNAQYWLAESYYGTRNFSNALVEFNKVEELYPASAKVPDARLKIAYIAYEKRQWSKARSLLNEVQQQNPDQRSGKLAAERLRRMNAEGV